ACDKTERKVRQSTNVQIDHGQLSFVVERSRFTQQTETRVVDHICGLEPLSSQHFRQLPHTIGRTKIDGNYMRLGMSLRCDRGRQCVKLRFSPCCQDHGVAMAGKDVGERRAYTRRRASDQANWLNG